jgi:hypothetical protein
LAQRLRNNSKESWTPLFLKKPSIEENTAAHQKESRIKNFSNESMRKISAKEKTTFFEDFWSVKIGDARPTYFRILPKNKAGVNCTNVFTSFRVPVNRKGFQYLQ